MSEGTPFSLNFRTRTHETWADSITACAAKSNRCFSRGERSLTALLCASIPPVSQECNEKVLQGLHLTQFYNGAARDQWHPRLHDAANFGS